MGLFTSFQLRSRDAHTRRQAALKLGVPGKTSSIADLEPLLADPDWSVRTAAAEALGAIGEARVAGAILDLLGRPDAPRDREAAAGVRASVVTALARLGTPAVAALTGALRDRNPRIREAAIEALGAIGSPAATTALAPALDDDRSSVRQAAAAAIGRSGAEEAAVVLGPALGHKDPATRKCVVDALGTAGTAAAVEKLRAAFGDRERSVREAAVAALARIPRPEASDALADACLSADRETRAAAMTALRAREWAPQDPRGRVLHAVLHGDFERAAAEGPAAVGPLTLALSEREAASRAGAARALARLGDARPTEGLCQLLADPDAAVRAAAVDALAGIGPAVAPGLARLLGDESKTARAPLAEVIARIGAPALVDRLAAPLRVGEPASHAGTPLQLVHDRAQLDEARTAADALEAFVGRVRQELPAATLDALAGIGDVMLVEEGERPSASDRVRCDAIRAFGTR